MRSYCISVTSRWQAFTVYSFSVMAVHLLSHLLDSEKLTSSLLQEKAELKDKRKCIVMTFPLYLQIKLKVGI